jgi:hypothetical protein
MTARRRSDDPAWNLHKLIHRLVEDIDMMIDDIGGEEVAATVTVGELITEYRDAWVRPDAP